MGEDLHDGIGILRAMFDSDPDYAWTWHCNLAMAFYDEIPESWGTDREWQHRVCNKAAARFMKSAFGAEGYEPEKRGGNR